MFVPQIDPCQTHWNFHLPIINKTNTGSQTQMPTVAMQVMYMSEVKQI